MSAEKRDDAFARHWAGLPEGKLELIDGRLVVSTLRGSRWIMAEMLRDYGPDYILPWAVPALWWTALEEAYHPRPRPRTPAEWREWSDRLSYEPEVEPAGPRSTGQHRRLYELLMWGLYHFAEETGLGDRLGRDFVIRLGENGLTPDQIVIDRNCLPRFYDRYVEGPPAIAIEIVQIGSEDQDRVLKRQLYEEAGVPEYWLIDAETRETTFLRLQPNGRYEPVTFHGRDLQRMIETGEDVIYHSVAVPGLSLSLRQLWTQEEHDWEHRWGPFLPLDVPPGERERFKPRKDGIEWDSIPFSPRVDLKPVPIRFDEFASWCGRAKFERYGGGIKIDGTEGSRRVAGMLLMTFGLIEVVKLAHPRDWVTFLDREPYLTTVQEQTERFMRRANYKRNDYRKDEIYYSGAISELPDLWGYGKTEEECRQDLMGQVRGWVLLRIARREPIPELE